MKIGVLSILALSFLIALLCLSLLVETRSTAKPLAIGFGAQDRYILYSDGNVYSLSSWNLLGSIKLPTDFETYILDFEVFSNIMYLYAYRSLNNSSGETIIMVYNISSRALMLLRKYEFYVKDNTTIVGSMVLNAIASSKGLAVLVANSTKAILEVYENTFEGLSLKAVYDCRMIMSAYRYGDSLLAIANKSGQIDSVQIVIPQVIDLFDDKVLFELPALIPVVTLAYPYVQIFERNGRWECYVTVYNPMKKSVEYYIVYPDRIDLIRSPRVTVSPRMDYAVMEHDDGVKVLLRDGTNITVPYRFTIIPYGYFMPLSPANGVIDIDIEKKAFLAKIVEKGVAKIMYFEYGKNTPKVVYELEASMASKISGFYGALVDNTIYILNPVNGTLLSIRIVTTETQDYSHMLRGSLILALVALISIITYKVMSRLRKGVVLY
ncbi:MAG: hypothetical protein QXY55_05470 [Candidatus Korarchaeota archaeon]